MNNLDVKLALYRLASWSGGGLGEGNMSEDQENNNAQIHFLKTGGSNCEFCAYYEEYVPGLMNPIEVVVYVRKIIAPGGENA